MRGDVRNITVGNEVRAGVIEGARKVSEVVALTYGPISSNVALQKSYGSFVVSKDGVSVARDIVLKDQHEDIGADLVIQASKKSADISGDGTSATIILAHHIMKLANQRIAAGFNAMGLRRGIDKASFWIKQELDKLSLLVDDKDLASVASISASDPEIGKLVADTVIKVGGVGITVEGYNGLGVIQDVVEGLYFDKGWVMPHFVTDRETEEAVHENVEILILEKRASANQDIIPLLEMIYKSENKTVLIIGNISGSALETCALTNVAGKVKVCVVNPPVYGDQVLPFLEDVAALTGGKVIPSSLPSDKVTSDYLGTADKVIVSQSHTTILGGAGVKEDISLRIGNLKKQLKSDKYNAFQKERMEFRLAKLQGKIGIIRVGGATETEAKEIKFRVEDSLAATRAAKEEGIVAGGAVTLAKIDVYGDKLYQLCIGEDEVQGFEVVMKALQEPFKQLMENAGEDGGYRLQQVLKAKQGYGFDVKDITDEPIDLVKAGVLDPVKVLKSVVENSCSVAGVAITLQGSVLIDREFQVEEVMMTKARQ